MVLRATAIFLLLASFAFFSFFGANEERLSWFDTRPALAAAAKYDATIIRDRFGVPHIFGTRDADVAYGLAYAHAEDDFATLQRALLSARGKLAAVDGERAAENDYFVQILGIWDAISARYQTDLSPETRALLDGYTAGLNLYAAQHRDEVLPGFAPAKPQDMVALFMLRLPWMYGLDNQLRALLAGNPQKVTGDLSRSRSLTAAVAPSHSTDGATRLLINPQGPFAGPESWYEARVSSGEGWNREGGLIPGSPVMLAAAGPNGGWGISANRPDLIDIYALKANPQNPNLYWFDGAWRRLETREARVVRRIWGPIRVISRRPLLRSVHGPAFRTRAGLFAMRYAGQGDLKGIEAFFRLNKAPDFNAFTAALAAGDIPSLSFVYADRTGRIASYYNAQFPDRPSGYDWSHPVPGDISADVWTSYLAATAAPKLIAPPSGFLIAANATPFRVTSDPYNPKPEMFPASMGIETGLNNRSRRALAFLGSARAITPETFRSFKYDSCFAPDSDFAAVVKDLAERNFAGDPLLEEAGENLRRYDLCTDVRSRTAALAVIAVTPLLQASANGLPRPDPVATLRNTAVRLLSQYARLDPQWGEINRLKRDELNLPLSGAPDALRDIELAPNAGRDAKSNARSGDSLILFSTWPRNGTWQVDSIVPFGNSRNSGTNRYDNQAQLYAQEKLKSVPLDPGALLAQATAIERPGKTPPRRAAPPRSITPPQQPFSFGQPATAAERQPVPVPRLTDRARSAPVPQ
jgi:penicillin amidase/acyl-homoserine-lactone acylase